MSHGDHAPVPLWQASRHGVVLWANPAAALLLEALGAPVGKALPPEEIDRVGLICARGEEHERDWRLGSTTWTLRYRPEPDGRHVVVAALDRTPIRAAEDRLVVADRAPALHPDPILRVDEEGVLRWLNQAARPVAEALGTDVGRPLPADLARAVDRALRDAAPQLELVDRPTGGWSLRLVPDVDGRAVYVFGMAIQHREAAEPSRSDAHFVANMGHELRTPLNAIQGYTELVQDELGDRGLTQAVDDLEKVRRSAGRLRAMIDDVVDLARLQAGRVAQKPSTFYVADLVDDVVLAASSAAEERGNALSVDVRIEPPELTADPTRLRAILAALLDNACKFTEQGTVRVEVRDVGGDRLHFRVSDTGVGLDSEAVATLFQPYTQRDGRASRAHGGTGLGLAIAQLGARRMGGEITVRSEPGAGSTFTVDLPREPPT